MVRGLQHPDRRVLPCGHRRAYGPGWFCASFAVGVVLCVIGAVLGGCAALATASPQRQMVQTTPLCFLPLTARFEGRPRLRSMARDDSALTCGRMAGTGPVTIVLRAWLGFLL